jgi:hypothetical protein
LSEAEKEEMVTTMKSLERLWKMEEVKAKLRSRDKKKSKKEIEIQDTFRQWLTKERGRKISALWKALMVPLKKQKIC